MASFRTILFCTIVFGGFGLLVAQITVNNVPKSIQDCYTNITVYNRFKRQPMRIENLISIIRKLEQKTNYLWDMRRISRTIVRRYQYEGMTFNPHTNKIEFAYDQFPLEGLKSEIIHELIPSQDVFPEGALDNDERCALHWMMSHSMNATMRDDEIPDRYGRAYREQLRAKRDIPDDSLVESIHFMESESGAKIRVPRALDIAKTNRPVETGVVYTNWGPISAGRLLAGIAAGLELQEKPVTYIPSSEGNPTNLYPNSGSNPVNPGYPGSNPGYPNGPNPGYPSGSNPGYPGSNPGSGTNGNWNFPPPQSGRKKRQSYGSLTFVNMKNLHAATLAGDIGQAAILNAPNTLENVQPPAGIFNDTICPREYILNSLPNPTQNAHHDHDTWTYMTAAEIRGGVDGLVLGSRIRNWDRGTTGGGPRLSQILEMYYSEDGVVGDNTYRACDRFQLMSGTNEGRELKEQSRSFAYAYNLKIRKRSITDETTGAFEGLVDIAYQKMNNYGSSMSAIDGTCVRRQTPGTGDQRDSDKLVAIKTTVYAVLDHSVTNYYEMIQQQRFIAKLAFDINVSPRGSRLGVVDGGSGNIMLKPNDTDNSAILACRVIDLPQFIRNQDVPAALKSIKNDLQRIEGLEENQEWTNGVGGGVIVLVLVQGKKLEENQRQQIREILDDFDRNHGYVHVIYVSNKYNQGDFDNFARNGGYDFIRLRGAQNMSDDTTEFTKEFARRSHARLHYPRCDDVRHDQNNEHLQPYDIFVTPGTIQYYQISPDDFFASVDLRFRFSSEGGKVRICISRNEKFPSSLNDQDNGDVECKETSGSYLPPTEGSRADIEFGLVKPCKKKRDGCGAIYLSITPTTTDRTNAAQIDCSTYGCETPDQLKVTWSHYGMRCGAMGLLASWTGSLLTAILSMLYFYKSF